jgi:hypothetical protein
VLQGATALLRGGATLSSAEVMATDLCASVGLLRAGLAADGETIVHRIYHLDHSYEALVASSFNTAPISGGSLNECACSPPERSIAGQRRWRRHRMPRPDRGRVFHRPHLAFVSGVGISLNGERWVACGPLLMLSIDPA